MSKVASFSSLLTVCERRTRREKNANDHNSSASSSLLSASSVIVIRFEKLRFGPAAFVALLPFGG